MLGWCEVRMEASAGQRQARPSPGPLSTLLTKVGQWLWAKVASPLLEAIRSFRRWVCNLLGGTTAPSRSLEKASNLMADPWSDGQSAKLTLTSTACRPPSVAPAKPAAPKEPCAPCAASSTAGVRSGYCELATRWQSFGAAVSAGLSSVSYEAAQDARAVSYVTGLQMLCGQL